MQMMAQTNDASQIRSIDVVTADLIEALHSLYRYQRGEINGAETKTLALVGDGPHKMATVKTRKGAGATALQIDASELVDENGDTIDSFEMPEGNEITVNIV